MYNLTIKDIVEQCKGKLAFGNPEMECISFSKDTRQINNGDVYIGIKGDNFDGNLFYEQAFSAGAKACVLQNVEINEEIKNKYNGKAIVIVEDTVKALQQMAEFKRSKYNIPVVAVTGSVGKTSTRDMIASVVSQKYNVLKTEGNLNNHIGLPLTILRLQNEDAMVVEMGMSNLGEIHVLSKIAKPSIAVITNVGTAHIGNLGSRQNILLAKLEILDGMQENGVAVINNDNDLLHEWYLQNKTYNVKCFGIENESDLVAKNIVMNTEGISYDLQYGNTTEKVEVKVPSKPFVYNSLAAATVGKILDISADKIKEGIKNFELTKNRMEIIKNSSITIINDCYNANFDSMKASVESLAQMGGRKIAILGDMLELGEYSKKIHSDIGEVVANNNIDMLITVGEEAKNIAKTAEEKGVDNSKIFTFNSNQEVKDFLKNTVKKDDTILVKASNGMKFIEIVEFLKEF